MDSRAADDDRCEKRYGPDIDGWMESRGVDGGEKDNCLRERAINVVGPTCTRLSVWYDRSLVC